MTHWNVRRYCAWTALVLLATLISGLHAQEAPGHRERPPRHPAGWQPEELGGLAHAPGILILGEQYVPPPLTLRVEAGALRINDLSVTCTPLNDGEGPRGRWLGSARQAYVLGSQIRDQLGNLRIVVALDDQPLVVVSSPQDQMDLLRKLAHLEESPGVRPAAIHGHLPADLDRQVWQRWQAEFQATPEFVARARAYVERFEELERAAQAAIAATRRLYDWSYPLSVVGMIAAVLGFGHLLSHRPPVGAKALDIDSSPLAISVLTWSLALVVLYSALDLTWTILAYQAGQMLELNPLGSHLINDPIQLMAFKAGATAVSVGLLFGLRKYCKAQLAAWWICLILTLLTARWLMMNSMIVA